MLLHRHPAKAQVIQPYDIDFLTTQGAAEALNLDPASIRNWARDGLLLYVRLARKAHFFEGYVQGLRADLRRNVPSDVYRISNLRKAQATRYALTCEQRVLATADRFAADVEMQLTTVDGIACMDADAVATQFGVDAEWLRSPASGCSVRAGHRRVIPAQLVQAAQPDHLVLRPNFKRRNS